MRKALRAPRLTKTLEGGKYIPWNLDPIIWRSWPRAISKPENFLYWKGLVHEKFVAWLRHCFELGPDIAATIQKSKLERWDGMPIY
jgi:hypothetical protein